MMAEAQPAGVLFWDFDGTLAHRPGMWAGALLAVLQDHDPASTVTREQIAPLLRGRFPWHTPETGHPQLDTPERWWQHVQHLLSQACTGVGFAADLVEALACQARARYLTVADWLVYDDALPILSLLTRLGWRHAIVSNHVPELPALVEGLGLAPFFDTVITSAVVGYEKPHPEIYRAALDAMGRPRRAWMIGDNVTADVLGAERAGMRAILVRGDDPRARWACADLHDVVALITGDDRQS